MSNIQQNLFNILPNQPSVCPLTLISTASAWSKSSLFLACDAVSPVPGHLPQTRLAPCVPQASASKIFLKKTRSSLALIKAFHSLGWKPPRPLWFSEMPRPFLPDHLGSSAPCPTSGFCLAGSLSSLRSSDTGFYAASSRLLPTHQT